MRTVKDKHTFHIFSTDECMLSVENILLDRRSSDVTSVTILNRISKEEDDALSEFPDSILN